LSKFIKVDPGVASRGIQRKVTEQIGNDLQTHTSSMKPRGHGVSENVDAVVVQPTTLEGRSHRRSHEFRSLTFTPRRSMPDKQRGGVRQRATGLQIALDGFSHVQRERESSPASRFGVPQMQSLRVPINIRQLQRGHFLRP